MSGSPSSGNLSIPTDVGQVEGTYFMRPGSVEVQITDKPFLLSCARIESELRRGLAALPAQPVAAPAATVVRQADLDVVSSPSITVLPITSYDFGQDEGSTITVGSKRTRGLGILGLLAFGTVGLVLFQRKKRRR